MEFPLISVFLKKKNAIIMGFMIKKSSPLSPNQIKVLPDFIRSTAYKVNTKMKTDHNTKG